MSISNVYVDASLPSNGDGSASNPFNNINSVTFTSDMRVWVRRTGRTHNVATGGVNINLEGLTEVEILGWPKPGEYLYAERDLTLASWDADTEEYWMIDPLGTTIALTLSGNNQHCYIGNCLVVYNYGDTYLLNFNSDTVIDRCRFERLPTGSNLRIAYIGPVRRKFWMFNTEWLINNSITSKTRPVFGDSYGESRPNNYPSCRLINVKIYTSGEYLFYITHTNHSTYHSDMYYDVELLPESGATSFTSSDIALISVTSSFTSNSNINISFRCDIDAFRVISFTGPDSHPMIVNNLSLRGNNFDDSVNPDDLCTTRNGHVHTDRIPFINSNNSHMTIYALTPGSYVSGGSLSSSLTGLNTYNFPACDLGNIPNNVIANYLTSSGVARYKSVEQNAFTANVYRDGGSPLTIRYEQLNAVASAVNKTSFNVQPFMFGDIESPFYSTLLSAGTYEIAFYVATRELVEDFYYERVSMILEWCGAEDVGMKVTGEILPDPTSVWNNDPGLIAKRLTTTITLDKTVTLSIRLWFNIALVIDQYLYIDPVPDITAI